MAPDYLKIGLKVGLEIHQQLKTRTKLFCDCKPELFKEAPEISFLRRLRPTQSELGQVDPAAFFEFQKGIMIRYEANRETSCLVEMDEEPPHPLNLEAVEVVLTAALMMRADPVDEVHVMRKTVIDGSNTTGFQRTCVIAMNGAINVGDKVVPIQHASLEEDAARKTGDEDHGRIICYRIDRLGIPLIEVATAPVIHSPEEAQDVALAIGTILRDTGKAMRGIGSIRQDLNVSIPNGALVEIKGVQELDIISRVVEYEVKRQLNLIAIREELRKRGLKEKDLNEEFFDISEIFGNTGCKVIKKALNKGLCVKAVMLPNFSDLLKWELMPDFRLGTELADRARFWGRVGGIFHTDELPAYGISEKEVEDIRKVTHASSEDAVVFVADSCENAIDALKAVVERAREALNGVPAETRAANVDGTTRYMRPRPGAARMYPETDIPPIRIGADLVNKINSNLPETSEKKFERLIRDFGLNAKLSKQVVTSEFGNLFEIIVKESGVSATTVAVFLTETMKALKRDGINIENVSDSQIREVFKELGSGVIMKESLADVFGWLSIHEDKTLQDAVSDLGLERLSEAELRVIVDRTILSNQEVMATSGKRAFGLLMGIIMQEVRGKADPELVSKLLRERLK